VGSYWCTDWNGNTVRGNSVSAAPRLAWILYESGSKCGSRQGLPVFDDNQFVGNTFRNQATGTWSSQVFNPGMVIDFSGDVNRNLVQNNDFGPFNGPFLSPLLGFIDGGGNICGTPNPGLSDFTCSGTSPGVRRGRGRVAPVFLPPGR
jgi:hypothetical protein